MKQNESFSTEVIALMIQAGWYKGRNALDSFNMPSDVEYPSQIIRILSEFGGLFIESSGDGVDLGRNSIVFDPSDADMESSDDEIIAYYSALLGKVIYPIGHIPDESLIVCVDIENNVYAVGDYLYWMGCSFVEGISNILLGIRGKKLKESDLTWMN